MKKILRWTQGVSDWHGKSRGCEAKDSWFLEYVITRVDIIGGYDFQVLAVGKPALKARVARVSDAKQLAELHARHILGPTPKVI